LSVFIPCYCSTKSFYHMAGWKHGAPVVHFRGNIHDRLVIIYH